jgi:hypothetical protein
MLMPKTNNDISLPIKHIQTTAVVAQEHSKKIENDCF